MCNITHKHAIKDTHSQGCLFAFFPNLPFNKCLIPFCCCFLFCFCSSLPKRPRRTESSTRKCFIHALLKNSSWSSLILRKPVQIYLTFEKHFYLITFSFVVSSISTLTRKILKLFVCLRSRKVKLAHHSPRKNIDVSLCQVFE